MSSPWETDPASPEREVWAWGLIEQVINDHANYIISVDLGEPLDDFDPYRALADVDAYDLTFIIMLLVTRSGESNDRAQKVLTGLRLAMKGELKI